MEQILLTHFARYPKMTPQDAVKLLYQSAFGPGHLIADQTYALRRLEEELAATPAHDGELLEPIGGGFARLHLGAAKAQNLPVSAIFDRFFAAATAEATAPVPQASVTPLPRSKTRIRSLFSPSCEMNSTLTPSLKQRAAQISAPRV